MKPTILVDVDGILVDFASTYLELLFCHTGRRHHQDEIHSFDFHLSVSSKEEDAAIWKHVTSTPGLVSAIPVYDGAMVFLDELRKLGRVVACTSPAGPLWTAERAQWLLQVAGFHKRDVVIASDKSLVRGDYLIDDATHNIEGWVAENRHGLGILFDRPWNRSAGCVNYTKAQHYAHVLEILAND